MPTNRSRGFLGIIVVAALVVGGVYIFRSFSRGSNAMVAVKYLNDVAKGVSMYAGTNGGLIPDSGNLLESLRDRKLLNDDLEKQMTGINLQGIERLGSAEYQIYLTCADTEEGRGICADILEAKARASGVLRTSGQGTNQIKIDMQL